MSSWVETRPQAKGYFLSESAFAKWIFQSADAVYMYVCSSYPGTATSVSLWQIKRIETSLDGNGNTQYIVTWADGNPNFDNIADNAESLTYS